MGLPIRLLELLAAAVAGGLALTGFNHARQAWQASGRQRAHEIHDAFFMLAVAAAVFIVLIVAVQS